MEKEKYFVYAGYYSVVNGTPKSIDTNKDPRGIEGVIGLADSHGRICEVRKRIIIPKDVDFSVLSIRAELKIREELSPEFLNGTIYYSPSLQRAVVSPISPGLFLSLVKDIKRNLGDKRAD